MVSNIDVARVKEIVNEVQKTFECITCNKKFSGMIFMCPEGHSICLMCYKNSISKPCSLCKSSIKYRNIPGELLSVELPAIIQALLYLTKPEPQYVSQHTEINKIDAKYCCQINLCQYKSETQTNLYEHIIQTHAAHQLLSAQPNSYYPDQFEQKFYFTYNFNKYYSVGIWIKNIGMTFLRLKIDSIGNLIVKVDIPIKYQTSIGYFIHLHQPGTNEILEYSRVAKVSSLHELVFHDTYYCSRDFYSIFFNDDLTINKNLSVRKCLLTIILQPM